MIPAAPNREVPYVDGVMHVLSPNSTARQFIETFQLFDEALGRRKRHCKLGKIRYPTGRRHQASDFAQ
jgi:hypothetical protein